MRKWIGRFFIFIGLLLIIGAGGLVAYNLWDDHRAEESALKVITMVKEEIPEIPEDEGEELYKKYPEKDMPVALIDGHYYIGVLDIPELELSLPVLQEWDYSNLSIAPCRYEGNVYQDNMVICAHNYRSQFGHLTYLEHGDTIYFTDVEGHRFEYILDYYEVIQPTDIEYLLNQDDENKWDLSLFTCTLGGKTRYTFRCKRVEEEN